MDLADKILKHCFKDMLPSVQPVQRAQLYRTLQSWSGEVKAMEAQLTSSRDAMVRANDALKSAAVEIRQLKTELGLSRGGIDGE